MVAFTFCSPALCAPAFFLIDTIGRQPLLSFGAMGMGISVACYAVLSAFSCEIVSTVALVVYIALCKLGERSEPATKASPKRQLNARKCRSPRITKLDLSAVPRSLARCAFVLLATSRHASPMSCCSPAPALQIQLCSLPPNSLDALSLPSRLPRADSSTWAVIVWVVAPSLFLSAGMPEASRSQYPSTGSPARWYTAWRDGCLALGGSRRQPPLASAWWRPSSSRHASRTASCLLCISRRTHSFLRAAHWWLLSGW